MAPTTVTKRERGCGFRVPGGNYIMGGNFEVPCDRLPMPIPTCCTCGNTIEFFRGAKNINPLHLFHLHRTTPETLIDCTCEVTCPVCYPPLNGWVMWVGEQNYTMRSFMDEARERGVSKRIAQFPKGMNSGDILYLAFKHAYQLHGGGDFLPAIFTASRITRLEHVLTGPQQEDPDYISALEAKGVVPVIEVD